MSSPLAKSIMDIECISGLIVKDIKQVSNNKPGKFWVLICSDCPQYGVGYYDYYTGSGSVLKLKWFNEYDEAKDLFNRKKLIKLN